MRVPIASSDKWVNLNYFDPILKNTESVKMHTENKWSQDDSA